MPNVDCGRIGPHRYALWFIPFMAYSLCALGRKTAMSFMAGNLIVMSLWFALGPSGTFRFNVVARTVLRYAPSFYHFFIDETFVESTLHRDGLVNFSVPADSKFLPVIYSDDEYGPRKILGSADNLKFFLENHDFEKKETADILRRASEKGEGVFYTNMPVMYKTGAITPKKFPRARDD
jgi:hypothetical protein